MIRWRSPGVGTASEGGQAHLAPFAVGGGAGMRDRRTSQVEEGVGGRWLGQNETPVFGPLSV